MYDLWGSAETRRRNGAPWTRTTTGSLARCSLAGQLSPEDRSHRLNAPHGTKEVSMSGKSPASAAIVLALAVVAAPTVAQGH